MNNIREKALSSTMWSFAETFGSQGIQFIFGIILARLLSPEDYGIIAVIWIFIGLSTVVIDSGFKTSIIRTANISARETSTIFWYNLLVSFFVSAILFLSSNKIALFFHKPQLELIIKVFAIVPAINGLGFVQNALMYKNLQFKLNTKIVLISNSLSGIIAITFALKGFEYWSLVAKTISQSIFYSSLLWIVSSWKPNFVFCTKAFKNHFSFGSRLLIVGLIDMFFEQIYSLIIGKYYSFKELGFYDRGKGYVDIFTKSISQAIVKVNSPILSSIKALNNDIVGPHRKILNNSIFIVYPLCLGLAAVASPLIFVLIGEKWLPAVVFLQLIAFSRLAYPIINCGASVFEVLGKSNLNLKYTVINRSFLICVLFVSTQFGIIALIIGNIIHSITSAFIIMYMLGQTVNLNIKTQSKDILRILIPSLIMAILMYVCVLLTTAYLHPFFVLLTSGLIGIVSYYYLSLIFKLEELNVFRTILTGVFEKIQTKRSY